MLDVCYFVSPADQYVSGVDCISQSLQEYVPTKTVTEKVAVDFETEDQCVHSCCWCQVTSYVLVLTVSHGTLQMSVLCPLFSYSMHISGSPDYMKLTCCAALSFVLQNFVHESWSNLSNCMSFYAMVWCVCRSCEEEEPEEGPAGWWWWWRRGLSWTVPIPKHLCDSYQVACVIEQAWMDSSASSLNVDLRVKLCQILSWQDVQDFRLFCAICWCLIKINLATWRIFLCDVWTVAVRMWHQCMLLLMSVCTFVFPLLLSIFFVPVLYRLTENYHFVQNT